MFTSFITVNDHRGRGKEGGKEVGRSENTASVRFSWMRVHLRTRFALETKFPSVVKAIEHGSSADLRTVGFRPQACSRANIDNRCPRCRSK